MIVGAPVVYRSREDVRQLLIDEVRRAGVLRPQDYFTRNWRIEPASRRVGAVPSDARRRRTGRRRRAARHAKDTTPLARRTPRPPTRLRILGTNDFHGALEPRVDSRGVRRGGAAYLAAAIRRAAAECAPPQCQVLLVDGGDEFQGTLASNLAFGRPIVGHLQRARIRGERAGQPRVRLGAGHAPRAHARRALRHPRRERPLRRRSRRSVDPRRHADRPRSAQDRRHRPRVRAHREHDAGAQRGRSPLPAAGSDRGQPRATAARPRRGLRDRARARRRLLRSRAQRCNGEIIGIAQSIHEPVDAIISGHTHSHRQHDGRRHSRRAGLLERNGARRRRPRAGRRHARGAQRPHRLDSRRIPPSRRLVDRGDGPRRDRSSISRSRRSPRR